MNKKILGRGAVGLGAALFALALTVSADAQSNFGTITLRTGFMPDPQTAHGTSGGNQQASSLFGSNCAGWLTQTPDHLLVLNSSFNFLRIFAESTDDTTIVVRTPSGQTLCNDDTYGRNPSVELRAAGAGQYSIWIGAYSQGSNSAYTLKLTELANVVPGASGATATPTTAAATGNAESSTRVCGLSKRGRPVCVDANARRPNFGCRTSDKACALTSGFTPDPWAFRLSAGGGRDPIDVSSLNLRDSQDNSACGRSFITPKPDFRFTFQTGTSFQFLRFYVNTQNGADATLLINTPDAHWRCNDDSFGGRMPSLDFRNPRPGRYDIWVGTYDGTSRNPATFNVTELESNHP